MTSAERVVALLTEQGRTVALAESLTGGALSDALVRVPGASACLRGAVVAYATDIKRDVLGVDAALLEAHGAVHPDVARQMAEGARRLLRADLGVATTGVAGPGAHDGHPAGTVHIAVATERATTVRSVAPSPDAGPPTRREVRAAAVAAALDLLLVAAGGTHGTPQALDRT